MKNTLTALILLTAFYSSESYAKNLDMAATINLLNEAPKFTAEQTISCILLLTNVFHLFLQEHYSKKDYKQIQDMIKEVWVSKIKAPEMEGVEIWRVQSNHEHIMWSIRPKFNDPEFEKIITHLYHYIGYYAALESILSCSYQYENIPYTNLEEVFEEFKRTLEERNNPFKLEDRNNPFREGPLFFQKGSRITSLCDFIHSGNKYLNRMFYDLAKIYNLIREQYTNDLPALKVPR